MEKKSCVQGGLIALETPNPNALQSGVGSLQVQKKNLEIYLHLLKENNGSEPTEIQIRDFFNVPSNLQESEGENIER